MSEKKERFIEFSFQDLGVGFKVKAIEETERVQFFSFARLILLCASE